MDGKLAYSLKELEGLLGIGESTARSLIASGRLASVRIGRRVLVSRAAVELFLSDAERDARAGHDVARAGSPAPTTAGRR